MPPLKGIPRPCHVQANFLLLAALLLTHCICFLSSVCNRNKSLRRYIGHIPELKVERTLHDTVDRSCIADSLALATRAWLHMRHKTLDVATYTYNIELLSFTALLRSCCNICRDLSLTIVTPSTVCSWFGLICQPTKRDSYIHI